jgi:hypothetical protein
VRVKIRVPGADRTLEFPDSGAYKTTKRESKGGCQDWAEKWCQHFKSCRCRDFQDLLDAGHTTRQFSYP